MGSTRNNIKKCFGNDDAECFGNTCEWRHNRMIILITPNDLHIVFASAHLMSRLFLFSGDFQSKNKISSDELWVPESLRFDNAQIWFFFCFFVVFKVFRAWAITNLSATAFVCIFHFILSIASSQHFLQFFINIEVIMLFCIFCHCCKWVKKSDVNLRL